MHNVPCRHVDFLRKTFQLFLEHHLKPLSQIHQSFIEDFLKNINELRDLADDFILCVIDVVGLYPDIPHKERLEAVRWTPFDEFQTISTDSLILSAECLLKNNVFEHNTRYFKQLRQTTIGIKRAPPYAIQKI